MRRGAIIPPCAKLRAPAPWCGRRGWKTRMKEGDEVTGKNRPFFFIVFKSLGRPCYFRFGPRN